MIIGASNKLSRAQLLLAGIVSFSRCLFIYLLDSLYCRRYFDIYIHIYTFWSPSWWASSASPLPVLYTRPGVIQFNGWENLAGLAKLPIDTIHHAHFILHREHPLHRFTNTGSSSNKRTRRNGAIRRSSPHADFVGHEDTVVEKRKRTQQTCLH